MHDGPERRITRWEHEHVLEAVQQRLDANPQAMRQRRETVEHPFGTMKARMGATHFLMKTLPKVAAEMALSRARLQSDARHEHRRHQAADRGDRRPEAPWLAPLRRPQGRSGCACRRTRVASRPKSQKICSKRSRRGASARSTAADTPSGALSHGQDPKLPLLSKRGFKTVIDVWLVSVRCLPLVRSAA